MSPRRRRSRQVRASRWHESFPLGEAAVAGRRNDGACGTARPALDRQAAGFWGFVFPLISTGAGMTTKAAFSPEEWTVVLEGPPSAGMIVVTAARGGMFRETLAMSKAYAESHAQHGESELLDEIVSAKPEMDHARYHSAAEVRDSGLQHLRDAVALLESKATAEELDGYRASSSPSRTRSLPLTGRAARVSTRRGSRHRADRSGARHDRRWPTAVLSRARDGHRAQGADDDARRADPTYRRPGRGRRPPAAGDQGSMTSRRPKCVWLTPAPTSKATSCMPAGEYVRAAGGPYARKTMCAVP